MNFSVLISDSRPTSNYILDVRQDDKFFTVDVNTLDLSDKNKVSAFLTLLGYHASINILNSSYSVEIYAAVTEDVISDNIDFDYAAAVQSDKDTIDAFVNLLGELTPAQ